MAVATSTAVIVGSMAAMSAYSANQAGRSANRQSRLAQENADRKYRLESGISEQQMEEQNQMALEQMTEVSREFLKAKSTLEAQRAESGVAGVTQQRIKANVATKESEAKGKVAKEINTNIVNIAQGMLAKKIDTDAIIREAESKKRNVALDTVLGGIQGGLQGYSMGKSVGSSTQGVGNNINSSYKPTTSANYGTSSGNWIGV